MITSNKPVCTKLRHAPFRLRPNAQLIKTYGDIDRVTRDQANRIGVSFEKNSRPYPKVPGHGRACKVAGLKGLSLHGLRRSFKSLTEWLEVPVGIVAQIQGHKPSATAEKHYTVRPLELLALHHNRIEAWILEQAGIEFVAKQEPAKLRVVNAT